MFKKLIKLQKENLKSLDSVSEAFYLEGNLYGGISESIGAFAVENTSCYSWEQKQFYAENSSLCQEALDYYGVSLKEWFRNGLDLESMVCRAGEFGEQYKIEQQCFRGLPFILKAVAIDRAIDHLRMGYKFDAIKFVEKVQGAYLRFNTFEDIDDLLYEYIDEEDESEE